MVGSRWRWKSRQVVIDSVSAERTLDSTTGLLAGKDENDPFIGINLEIPFLLRSSEEPNKRVSRESVILEQAYREAARVAEYRLR